MHIYIDRDNIAWTEIDPFAISIGVEPKQLTEYIYEKYWQYFFEYNPISLEVVREGFCDVRVSALAELGFLEPIEQSAHPYHA